MTLSKGCCFAFIQAAMLVYSVLTTPPLASIDIAELSFNGVVKFKVTLVVKVSIAVL